MAKGDKGKVQDKLATEQTRVNDQFGNIYNNMEEKRRAIETQSQQERDVLTGTLTPLAQSTQGGLDPTVINNIRGLYGGKTVGYESGTGAGSTGSGGDSSGSSSGGGAGVVSPPTPSVPSALDRAETTWNTFNETGGVDMARMQSQITELENLAKTGGFKPEDLAGVNDTIAKLKNFQYNPQAKAQVEGAINDLLAMGKTGGYDPNQLGLIRGDIDKLRAASSTGGVDPNELARQRAAIDFMRSGGISASDLERFRGTGFQEFANTGGWTDEQKAEFRNRATSAIPSLYANTRNEAERLRNIQGGSGGAGFLAGMSKLNRQQGQQFATAARDAEMDLGTNVREGRKWGIEGLRDTEAQIQTQLGTNRTAGLGASNQLELGIGANKAKMLDDVIRGGTALEQGIANNRIAATDAGGKLQVDFQNSINEAIQRSLTGAGNLEANIAQAVSQNRVKSQEAAAQAEATAQRLSQEGKIAGAQGLMQVAAQKEAAARAAASQAASARANDQANERWWAQFISGNERAIGEMQMSGQQNALRNLTQVYGMDPTLQRDAYTSGIAGDWANINSNNLRTEAGMASGGKDWMDYARLGAGLLNGFGGGGSSGGGAGGGVSGLGGYQYDSDNPNSVWYDGGTSGGAPNPTPRPSDDQWWIDNGL